FSRRFDGVEVEDFDATGAAERAYDAVDEDVREAIETAAANVRAFHERQVPEDWTVEPATGRELGRTYYPLDSAGVYVPGGTAAYPTSVLMGVIPARVAGVDRVAVATPARDDPNPVTLAAMHVADVDAVYRVGGAQAIAALAYGTESIEAVDVIVGPGNRWVTAAKAEVRGDVRIDMLAGPSEVLALADDTADSAIVAAEVIAQAEHDPNAGVVAVTPDADLAHAIATAIEEQVADRDRSDVVAEALDNDASGVFLADSMDDAVQFARRYAPEHLHVWARESRALLDRIEHYGSAFLGEYTPVAVGDYASGTNHVLPTGGSARIASGLSVDDFLRSATHQAFTEEGLATLRDTVTTLADAEGLEAHAFSVDVRFED
ncbi:MAG: histidinol dehydrogenase, partial [Halanaeroarchaeum sp.]